MRAVSLALLLAIFIPAIVFAANVGDRARDISGWDMVSQRTVSLADYSGKWVLLVFWASW
jgi:hypothetical protein